MNRPVPWALTRRGRHPVTAVWVGWGPKGRGSVSRAPLITAYLVEHLCPLFSPTLTPPTSGTVPLGAA